MNRGVSDTGRLQKIYRYPPLSGLNNTASSTGTGPKAYLNWVVTDQEHNFVTGGYQRLTTVAKENGPNWRGCYIRVKVLNSNLVAVLGLGL